MQCVPILNFVVQFSEEEKVWVAAIDWDQIRQMEEFVGQAKV